MLYNLGRCLFILKNTFLLTLLIYPGELKIKDIPNPERRLFIFFFDDLALLSTTNVMISAFQLSSFLSWVITFPLYLLVDVTYLSWYVLWKYTAVMMTSRGADVVYHEIWIFGRKVKIYVKHMSQAQPWFY